MNAKSRKKEWFHLHQLVVVSAQFCFEMNNNLNQLPFILYLTTKPFFVLFFLFFWKRDLCSRWWPHFGNSPWGIILAKFQLLLICGQILWSIIAFLAFLQWIKKSVQRANYLVRSARSAIFTVKMLPDLSPAGYCDVVTSGDAFSHVPCWNTGHIARSDHILTCSIFLTHHTMIHVKWSEIYDRFFFFCGLCVHIDELFI